MKHLLPILIIAALIWPLPAFIPSAQATEIADGDLIRAIGDFDVWIVKYVGAKKFRRLILNPDVFNMYGHLRWGDIMDVEQSIVDGFTESTLVRADGDTKVYKLYPAGDTGEKRWIETLDIFNAWGFDWDAVYIINTFDRDSYVTGTPFEAGPEGLVPAAPVLEDPGTSVSSGTAFTITWSQPENTTSYTLERDTSSSFISPTTVYTGSANTTVDNLTPSTATIYYYRVKATNTNGDSPWSNVVDMQITTEGVPGVPTLTDPGTSVTTGTSFTISWSAVSNVTVYVLEQDTNSAFSDPTTITSVSGSETSYSHTLTPDATTIYYFRVQARNNIGHSAWSNVVDMQVTAAVANQAPVLASIGSKSVDEGLLLEFTISATDADGDTLTYSASNLPSGASFNTSTKTFSWAPAYDKAGTSYVPTFTVSDGTLTDSETVTITVADVSSIPQNGGFEEGDLSHWQKTGNWEISTTQAHTGTYSAHIYTGSSGGTAGLMYTFDYPIPVNDIQSFTWWYYREGGDNICVGVTYSNGDYEQDFIWGAVSDTWTQRNSTGILDAGKSVSKITFFDAISNNHTYIDDVVVATPDTPATNQAPILSSIGSKSVDEGSLLEFTISATDADGDNLTYSASNLPTGASFNVSTQTFSWTPGYDQAGSHSVTFSVSDGSLTDSETITITVNDIALTINVPGDYTTIQAAIDAANSGDTIQVAAGTYSGPIALKSGITITGAGIDSTFIQGGSRGFTGWNGGATDVTIQDLTVRNSGAWNVDGAGIDISYSSNVIIDRCKFYNNSAVNGAGAYFSHSSNVLIKNSIFASNSASNNGGALVTHDTTITLENITMADNSGSYANVGGISASGGSTITVLNSIIYSNGDNLNIWGGSTLTATYSDIGETVSGTGNINQNPQFVGGGDYHLQTSSPCIDTGDPTSSYSNEPSPNGGRINMGAYGNTSGATCYNPIKLVPSQYATIQAAITAAQSGDTIQVAAGTFSGPIALKSGITITGAGIDSTFIQGGSRGFTGWNGGATDVTIQDLTVRNSGAWNVDGAGMDVSYSSNVTIERCKFYNNSAVNGAGAYFSHSSGVLIKNTIFASNSASNNGGALVVHDTTITLQNITMADNSGSYANVGGISASGGSTITVLNSIIYSNGDNLNIWGGSTLTATYSDIGETVSGTGNINQNPKFVGGGDYHLQTSSPCIDTGDPNSAYSNEPSPNGGRINMGAYGNTSGAESAASPLGQYAGPDTSSAGVELTNFTVSGSSTVGGTITVKYTYRNTTASTLNFTPYGILVGCRNPSWSNEDFGSTGTLTLGAGESYTLTATRAVDAVGTWRFWPAYYVNSAWGTYRWHEITVEVSS